MRRSVWASAALALGATWYAAGAVALGGVIPLSTATTVAGALLDVVVTLLVARRCGISPAITVGIASVITLDWYCIPPVHERTAHNAANLAALGAYLLTGTLLGELAAAARRRAQMLEREGRLLAEEQAALRRVATLVAREESPASVFAAVAKEIGTLLPVDAAALWRYEADNTVTAVGVWGLTEPRLPVGTRASLSGVNMAAKVLATGRPARMDGYTDAPGEMAATMRALGVRSTVGCPVFVQGKVWGVMVGASFAEQPVACGTEARLAGFTELAGTAVANAQSRAELTASRARVVASGDEARRRIARDLHDGAQQRLVTLLLELSVACAETPPEAARLRSRLERAQLEARAAIEELRELAAGVHPAVLTRRGLVAALEALAARSPVPATVVAAQRFDALPGRVAICAYYVAAEAVTNAIKHAGASRIILDVHLAGASTLPELRLTVTDDGVGQPSPCRAGTGLLGMTDRAAALGGRVCISDAHPRGTTVELRVPLAKEPAVDSVLSPALQDR